MGDRQSDDSAAASLSETPARIGPYRIDGRLGTGGMGRVWRAQDERLGRHVAIKQILPERSAEAVVRGRFRREARSVARLNHPAIVQIYDILEHEDGDWIVMELVEGRTLRELGDGGPIPTATALRVAYQVCCGLAVAHAAGIIHRDLKVENVMVNGEGQAKILDFGLAKHLQCDDQEATLSTEGGLIGTSRTMSPEQAMGQAVDHRSDLFSLGTLLYEAVTGESPFRASNAALTLARVCNYRQRPVREVRPEVPRELSRLIEHLLEKSPERRPAGAEEVAAAVARIAGFPSDSLSDSQSSLSFPPPFLASAPLEETGPSGVRARRSGRRRSSDRRPGSSSTTLTGPVFDPSLRSGAAGAPPPARSLSARSPSARSPSARPPEGTGTLSGTAGPPGRTPGSTADTATNRWPWLAAMVMIAALALAFFVVRQEPSRSSSREPVLAVLGFKNLGQADAAWLSTALAELMSSELASSGGVRLISDDNIARMKRELELPEVDSLSDDTLRDIRKYLDTDFVVIGSFLVLDRGEDPTVQLLMRLQDTRGEVPIEVIRESGTRSELFDLVTRTGAELRSRLGFAATSVSEAEAARGASPPP